MTITQEINAQYAAFTTAFNKVLDDYEESINEQSTNTVPVSTTVTAAYTYPNSTIQVADAAVFGAMGTFTLPVAATAFLGTVQLGNFTLIGSSQNQVILNTASSSAINLPVGAVLNANVPTSAATSAAAVFPSYITNSTTQLATNLVEYFIGIPVKLPAKNTPPHTPVQRGALQAFVYQNIAGNAATTSLQDALLAITLPTTTGPDLDIYKAAAASAIAQSRQYVLNGITGIFNRTLLVNALAPANRLGVSFNTGTGSSSGSTSSSSSSSTGSGSTGSAA